MHTSGPDLRSQPNRGAQCNCRRVCHVRVSIDCVTCHSLQILDGEGKGLLGIQSALGRYELDAEKGDRQIVWFEAICIAPADKGPDALKRWLAVFKSSNPDMVSKSCCPLPHTTKRRKAQQALPITQCSCKDIGKHTMQRRIGQACCTQNPPLNSHWSTCEVTA